MAGIIGNISREMRDACVARRACRAHSPRGLFHNSCYHTGSIICLGREARSDEQLREARAKEHAIWNGCGGRVGRRSRVRQVSYMDALPRWQHHNKCHRAGLADALTR